MTKTLEQPHFLRTYAKIKYTPGDSTRRHAVTWIARPPDKNGKFPPDYPISPETLKRFEAAGFSNIRLFAGGDGLELDPPPGMTPTEIQSLLLNINPYFFV